MTTPVPGPAGQPSPESIDMVRKFAAKVGGEAERVVEEAIKLIHMGLGNPAKLSSTREAWNVTAVSAVATGANGIRNSLPDLQARWTGPAATAFTTYSGNVLTASEKMGTALGAVGGAVTDAINEATNTYRAVVEFIGACGETIFNFLATIAGKVKENAAELIGGVAQAILTALGKFVNDYSTAVSKAIGIITGYKTAANKATSAIATLGENLVPDLPATSGDADSYTPAKA